MTTPVLTAATGPAALPGGPAAAAAPEGVFAGLLADAAPAAAPAATAAGLAPASATRAGLAALLDLPAEDLQEPVLPDGTLLGAQALGLLTAPLLLDVPAVGPGPAETSPVPAPQGALAAPLAVQADAVQADATPTLAAPSAATAPAAAAAAPGADAATTAASVDAPVPGPAPVPQQGVPATPADAAATGPAPADALAADVPAHALPADDVRTTGTSGGDEPPAVVAETAAPGQTGPVQPPAGTAPATAPGAPAPLEQLAAERGPEQVRPAVAELARGLRDAGGGRASLVVRLDPPELGPVLVRLTVQDGRVDVQLRTSEAVAAVGLGSASADVRSTLLEHGLDLSSFDVSSDAESSFSQQLSQGSPDRGTPGRRQGADDSQGATGAGAATGAVITETTADGAPAGTWL